MSDYRTESGRAQNAIESRTAESRTVNKAMQHTSKGKPGVAAISWTLPPPITESEFARARLTPDCIVEEYLFADVAVIVAPGGSGKTTLLLYESIHIALGLPLYGLKIHKAGPVLILTAEDSREMLVARLRSMARAMQLSAESIATVMSSIRISDVSGRCVKLTTLENDIVVPAQLADIIVRESRDLKPVLVTIDPAVSFGIGEARVNDAEQGLVEAARRIRSKLNCCVRYVHHTGKQNAREKAVDQYAGRGGSALPDGARMVAVLQRLNPKDWYAVTGRSLVDGEAGMVLARPKLSCCPPASDILIARNGFTFLHTIRAEHDPIAELQMCCDKIMNELVADLDKGTRHTQRSLEALKLMSRIDLRDAVSTLVARGRVQHASVLDRGKGGPSMFLQPIAAPSDVGAPLSNSAP
jgi:regulatory protein RepA